MGNENKAAATQSRSSAAGGEIAAVPYTRPPLRKILNLYDFENVARNVLSREAWAYYHYGSEDEAAVQENTAVWNRVWLRPRVLVDVLKVDSRCDILGQASSMPLYISATASGKLGYEEGELALTRAAGKARIPTMISTLASYPLEECAEVKVRPTQPLFAQLYISVDRDDTLETIRELEQAGAKAVFVTVDTAQLGRRERSMCVQLDGDDEDEEEDREDEQQEEDNEEEEEEDEGGGMLGVGAFDASLNWDTIAWLRSQTKLPLVLKGIGRWEDAITAAKQGLVNGVVFSNHGGRQLGCARSGLEVLAESVAKLQEQGLVGPNPREPRSDGKLFSLFVDGGVRRGSDVVKALALGATAVGIGRPSLYALSSYGERGVLKALTMLREEMHLCQRLVGAPTLDQITPDLVDAGSIHNHSGPVAPRGLWTPSKL